MFDWILSALKSIGEWILDILMELISGFVGYLLYGLEVLGAKAIGWLFDAFKMLAGVSPVSYNGKNVSITSVILGRGTIGGDMIGNVYMRFAVVGFALAIGFGIAATIKKFFDYNMENKVSYVKILTNLLKSVILILLMSTVLFVTMECTRILLETVINAFTEARKSAGKEMVVKFDDKDYQLMGNIMDTIGDYSLNPSYNSRYNLNACYNDIRKDLKTLDDRGKFRYPFSIINDDYHWQWALQQIVNVADLTSDMPLDVYDDELAQAIMKTMDLLTYDAGFKPISRYSYAIDGSRLDGDLDISRTIMVIGSLGAARPHRKVAQESLFDAVREPYTYGDKNIFSFAQVERDFNVTIFEWNHVTVILLIIFLFPTYLGIVINVAGRLFNMIFLYLIFPFVAATLPYDDGAKMKQWTMAFIIQAFSFFGTVIAVQLFMIMLPVIYDSALTFSTNSVMNWFVKSIVIISFAITSSKASDMLSGILAENASKQALDAGNMGASGVAAIGGGISTVFGMGKTVFGWVKGDGNGGDKGKDDKDGKDGKGGDAAGSEQKNLSGLGGLTAGTGGGGNGGGNEGGGGDEGGGNNAATFEKAKANIAENKGSGGGGRKRSASFSAGDIHKNMLGAVSKVSGAKDDGDK